MLKAIFEEHAVRDFLTRPIDLEKEWKLAQGLPLDGEEKFIYYTAQEQNLIETELDRIYNHLSSGCGRSRGCPPRFTLTAGGPGAGKTTLLNGRLPSLLPAVYADPDETVLKNMKPYQEDLALNAYGNHTMIMAYTKWRWASNYISNASLNRACGDGFDIVFGTTATSPAMTAIYKAVREAGFNIDTLIVAAPEDVRTGSALRRHQEEKSRFIPEQDVIEKGRFFYMRLPEYFCHTDRFELYWRDDVAGPARLTAKGENGRIDIIDARSLTAFEEDITQKDPVLNWVNLSAIYSNKQTPQPSPKI